MRDFKPEAYVSVINRFFFVSGKSISHDTERGRRGRGKGGHRRFRRDYNKVKHATTGDTDNMAAERNVN